MVAYYPGNIIKQTATPTIDQCLCTAKVNQFVDICN